MASDVPAEERNQEGNDADEQADARLAFLALAGHRIERKASRLLHFLDANVNVVF
jgi:hypothetical protein